jgi:hypothetical protein
MSDNTGFVLCMAIVFAFLGFSGWMLRKQQTEEFKAAAEAGLVQKVENGRTI